MGDVKGDEGAWNYHEDGVISERDEMEGQEHEEAMKSPPKDLVCDWIARYVYLILFHVFF